MRKAVNLQLIVVVKLKSSVGVYERSVVTTALYRVGYINLSLAGTRTPTIIRNKQSDVAVFYFLHCFIVCALVRRLVGGTCDLSVHVGNAVGATAHGAVPCHPTIPAPLLNNNHHLHHTSTLHYTLNIMYNSLLTLYTIIITNLLLFNHTTPDT